MSDDSVLVLCMKWGTLYGPEYVNRLQAGVALHLARKHRFICFTDDANGLAPAVEALPLPTLDLPAGSTDTRWRKLAMFRPDLAGLHGTALFLDLDLVIVGALDALFDLPGDVLIIRDDDLFRTKPLRRLNPERDRFKHSVGNSSVFRYRIGAHADVLERYLNDPAAAGARYENEQEYLSGELIAQGRLQYWPHGWCVSFKNDCVPRHVRSFVADPALPAGARIVVFAGNPKMSEVLAGVGGRWYRRVGDVEWLRRAWRDEG